MNDITTAVKDTLAGQAHDVAPPPIDHAAFDAAVRGVRRRRRALLSAVGGVAAAATLLAGVAVVHNSTSGAGRLAPSSSGNDVISHPPYTLASDGFVGNVSQNGSYGAVSTTVEGLEDAFSTKGGLLLVDGESRLVEIPYTVEGKPVDSWTWEKEKPLADGPVQRVVVSRDGRSAAWITLDDHLVVYDLVHDAIIRRTEVSPQALVYGVAGDAILLQDSGRGWGDRLHLVTDGHDYAMGEWTTGTTDNADVTDSVIAVTSGDRTQIVRREADGQPSGRAMAIDAGAGQLSPDGANYVGLTMEENATGTAPAIALWSTADGRRRDLTGLPRFSREASWIGPDTIAVMGGAAADASAVYVCDVVTAKCGQSIGDGLPEMEDDATVQLPSSFVAAP